MLQPADRVREPLGRVAPQRTPLRISPFPGPSGPDARGDAAASSTVRSPRARRTSTSTRSARRRMKL